MLKSWVVGFQRSRAGSIYGFPLWVASLGVRVDVNLSPEYRACLRSGHPRVSSLSFDKSPQRKVIVVISITISVSIFLIVTIIIIKIIIITIRTSFLICSTEHVAPSMSAPCCITSRVSPADGTEMSSSFKPTGSLGVELKHRGLMAYGFGFGID